MNKEGLGKSSVYFHPDDFTERYVEGRPLRRTVRAEGFAIDYVHEPYDPPGINRVNITAGGLHVELLPSKGMSVGRVRYKGRSLLWPSLLDVLPDPAEVDLSGPLIWNGEPVSGFGFIEYLVGGVMMFGLGNWGMPYEDGETGEKFTLHGEVSNIPVEGMTIRTGSASLEVSGEFFYS